MNKFIVGLKCNYNDDIGRYFENRGCEIVFKDGILKDVIIIETSMNRVEVIQLQYVDEANKPRIGSFNDHYMQMK